MPILMMVNLVLVLEATISEAAHSVLKGVIIVICPFRFSKESTQNFEGKEGLAALCNLPISRQPPLLPQCPDYEAHI